MAKISKKNQKVIKKFRKRFFVPVTLFLVVVAILFVSLSFENKIDDALGLREIEHYDVGDKVSIGAMTVHFIDIGQADCTLLELPDGKTMLIDAGAEVGKKVAPINEKLKEYMEDVNESRQLRGEKEFSFFDYVIITHSDFDHIASIEYILDLYPADVFYRPNQAATDDGYHDPAYDGTEAKNRFWEEEGAKDSNTYREAIAAGYAKSNEQIVTNPYDDTQNCIKPENTIQSSNEYYEVNFYGPIKPSYRNENDYSPIMIVEYKGRKIALTGDSEAEGESDFVQKATEGNGRFSVFDGDFSVDIFALGHHGSLTSTSQGIIDVFTKADKRESVYIIISCGAGNSYNHPRPETLERIKASGFLDDNVLRTDQKGDLIFNIELFEEGQKAVISSLDALPQIEYKYPMQVMGIAIRYKHIAYAAMAVFFVLMLIACGIMAAIQKKEKEEKKKKKGKK